MREGDEDQDAAASGRRSLVEKVLKPGEELVWSGGPRTGLAAGDSEMAAFAAVFSALFFGVLGRQLGIEERKAFEFAALFGCALGVSISIARAAVAGTGLSLMLETLAPTFVVAAAVGGRARWIQLIWPAFSLSFLLLWLFVRYLEHRTIRYHLSPNRAFIEEPGRYVISFELVRPPVSIATPLSRRLSGRIELAPAVGQLRTGDGLVMGVPARRRRFVRVDEPDEVVKAWHHSRSALR